MSFFVPSAEFLDPKSLCQEHLNFEQTQKRSFTYYYTPSLPALIDEFITKTEAKTTSK